MHRYYQKGIPGWDKMRQGGGTELRVRDVSEGSSGGHVEVVCRDWIVHR